METGCQDKSITGKVENITFYLFLHCTSKIFKSLYPTVFQLVNIILVWAIEPFSRCHVAAWKSTIFVIDWYLKRFNNQPSNDTTSEMFLYTLHEQRQILTSPNLVTNFYGSLPVFRMATTKQISIHIFLQYKTLAIFQLSSCLGCLLF